MNDIGLPLASNSWDEREYAAIERVVRSGTFTMGPEVAGFEREFAGLMGCRFAVMVNSGSSANLLIVAALRYHSRHGLGPGDEVIVPAVSWSTTYFPLQQYGLRVKFVDIDGMTLNFDLARLEAAISPKTRAVLAVNLLGNPNDFARLRAIVGAREIILLEDNCEAMGARFEDRHTGTFGLAGSFSCFYSHHISTMEGGVAVTDDEELYHIMLCLRSHGWTRNLPQRNLVTGTKGDDPFEESFRFVLPGYNLRPLELSGAIGREQIQKLPAIVEQRRRNAERFGDLMADFPQFTTQQEVGESSWFGFSLVLNEGDGLTRKRLVQVLQRRGLECRPIVAGNFARNEVTRFMDHEVHGTLANADHIDRNGLFIGNHPFSLEDRFPKLRRALREALAAGG